MLSNAAKIFGVIFVVVGLLGFIPAASSNGLLFGFVHTNTGFNLLYLGMGILGTFAGLISNRVSKIYFLITGILFGIIAFFGFAEEGRPVLGFIARDLQGAWMDLTIAAISVFIGSLPEYAREPHSRGELFDH